MKIAGLQKLTLIDYPQTLACTVFLVGCNFRCPFCYNSELVLPEKINKNSQISEKEFFNFLKERKGYLEGVCIGGGEPTTLTDLPEFAKRIKKLGYKVKIDTNGSNPQMLENLIEKNLVDYIARH
jgi:pyruvate formate lyase activating enzyme